MVNNGITSITSGPRKSNIELLRILAMFLVLVVHTSFLALGKPELSDFESAPIPSFTKTFFESVSVVAVNVFVLISGWFGIRSSLKGLGNFIFQCIFFLFGIYILSLATGLTPLSLKGIESRIFLTKGNWWFITAYLALYILSPVLNCFIDKASKEQFKCILIGFFIFQTLYGWFGAAGFICGGYSCFSFIGLYLLARYVKIYEIHFINTYGILCYILSVIFNTIAYYICVRIGTGIDIYAYVNPIVIIGSLGLVAYFDKLKIGPNQFINWVAKSSFAVYLFHIDPNVLKIFKDYIVQIYSIYSGLKCITYIFIFLLIVYTVAVILDQFRKLIWQYIRKILQNIMEQKGRTPPPLIGYFGFNSVPFSSFSNLKFLE